MTQNYILSSPVQARADTSQFRRQLFQIKLLSETANLYVELYFITSNSIS